MANNNLNEKQIAAKQAATPITPSDELKKTAPAEKGRALADDALDGVAGGYVDSRKRPCATCGVAMQYCKCK